MEGIHRYFLRYLPPSPGDGGDGDGGGTVPANPTIPHPLANVGRDEICRKGNPSLR